MRKGLIALLALIAFSAAAVAQTYMPTIPPGAVPIAATSGNVANATAAAAFSAVDGQRNYLCGYSIRSLGATTAGTVAITSSGMASNLNHSYFTVAGAGIQNQPMDIVFEPCMVGLTSTAIFVSLAALGAGNTNAFINIWGYRY